MEQTFQEASDISRAREKLTRRFTTLLIERLNLEYEPEDLADDTPLFSAGIGLDSIDALEIALAIETEFGCEVTVEDMHVFRSVNSVVDFIQQSTKSSSGEAA